MPFRVSRAPSAGTSTLHIPYGCPGIELGCAWTNNGSPISYQVSTIRSFSVSRYSVQKSRAFFDAPRVKIRDDGLVRNKAVYIALALNSDGEKEVLAHAGGAITYSR
jgi:hypothetical protein